MVSAGFLRVRDACGLTRNNTEATPVTQVSNKKGIWKNLLLLAGTLVFCGFIGELTLRLLWKQGRFAVRIYQSAPYLVETRYWKTWHYPNAQVHFVKDCLDISYSTNSFGMRGKEADRDTTRPSIALLGDSFVEGYAVNNGETIGSSLERLLDGRYQVLNFGVSGGFGTVHEAALYHNYARYFHPAWVVLFFVNYNDLYDNLNAVSDGLVNGRLELSYPIAANFDEVASALPRKPPASVGMEAPRSLYLFRFLSRSLRIIGASIQYWWNIRTDFNNALINVYTEPETESLRKGWTLARESLSRLKVLADQDNARLLVVELADPYQTDPNWLRFASLGKSQGKTIDPMHPNRRLEAICRDLKIAFYDTYPEVVSYIKARQMRFPYLSYTCDRHYTPEGNALIAKLVAQELR